MNNSNIDSIIQAAKNSGSYFITATIKDPSKEENNLAHYAVQEEFPRDDIIPSLDHAVRSLGIKPEQPVPITKAPEALENEKPLKIAIITHFNRCPDSYSPGRAVKNQIKMLQHYGHEVVFFTQEGSTLDIGCEMRPVVPKFKREKGIVDEDAKTRMIDMLRSALTNDFDIAITHDFYIDDCITYREAIRECGVPIKWLHWARSGVGRPIDFRMDNTKYVYMNYADVGGFARNIGVRDSDVRVIFNEKDPSLMFDWHPTTRMVSDKMRLWEKDVIQTYPICTTRMDAKGLNSVIATFGALKRQGKNVALIVCNSNGRRRVDEIEDKLKFAREVHGLDETDFVFTSLLSDDGYDTLTEVPNKVVAQLMQISNLFVFPTIAEVCSNVLLEASMAKNLLVINEDLPCLFDFVDTNAVLKHPFTSLKSMHYAERDPQAFDRLAKIIIGQLESNKPDKQFRKVWSTHSFDAIYHKMLAPVLYE